MTVSSLAGSPRRWPCVASSFIQNAWIVPKNARPNASIVSRGSPASRISCRVRCCISSAARFVYVTTTSCGSHSSARGPFFAISRIRSVIARVLPEPAEAITEKFRSNSRTNRCRAVSSAIVLIWLLLRARMRDASLPIFRRADRCRSAASRVDIF